MQPRILYIEAKNGLAGPARIGRVEYSKTGRTIYYRGAVLRSLKGDGYKANYFDALTGRYYWVSGPRRDGMDCLYPAVVEIDDDAREQYWTEIRAMPEARDQTSFRSPGKYDRRRPK